MPARAVAAALAACTVLAACGRGAPHTQTAPSTAAAPSTTASPSTPAAPSTTVAPAPPGLCGFRPAPGVVDKVLVVFEENHDYSSIVGSPDAPTLNRAASECGLATNYRSLTHPSLPNYLTATSGLPYDSSPFTSDCSPDGGACMAQGPSIFSQEEAVDKQWRSYEESMPTPCDRTSAGAYAARHNPAVYSPDLRSTCPSRDVALGTTTSGPLADDVRAGTMPAYAVLTPNLDHDMHDGTVRTGDSWLAPWLALITAGPDYRSGHLAVLVVWDEGSGEGRVPSHVPLLVLSASTHPGTRVATPLDHRALLRTSEALTGVQGPLPPVAGSPSFAAAFGLSP